MIVRFSDVFIFILGLFLDVFGCDDDCYVINSPFGDWLKDKVGFV